MVLQSPLRRFVWFGKTRARKNAPRERGRFRLSPVGRGRARSARVRGVRPSRLAPPHPPCILDARPPLPTGERERNVRTTTRDLNAVIAGSIRRPATTTPPRPRRADPRAIRSRQKA